MTQGIKARSTQKRVYDIDAARLSYVAGALHMSSQDILAPWIRTLYNMIAPRGELTPEQIAECRRVIESAEAQSQAVLNGIDNQTPVA